MSKLVFPLTMLLLIASSPYAIGVTIQFGGDSTIVSDTNFQSQIGASQIIQWNGVNSDGGSFGASGTVNNQGTGATLTSLGGENLILSSQVIEPSDPNAQTFSTSTPNVLGVKGGDNAKFDSALGESWTFDFNQVVVLEHLVFTALNGNNKTIELTLAGGTPVSFTRIDSQMALVTYGPTSNRYVYTPAGGGIPVAAGDDIKLASLVTGAWGLQAVVVSVIPEPSAIMLISVAAMLGITVRRRR